jgi:hypothetical protein
MQDLALADRPQMRKRSALRTSNCWQPRPFWAGFLFMALSGSRNGLSGGSSEDLLTSATEHRTVDLAQPNCLPDDAVEDRLSDHVVLVMPTPVLPQGLGVDYLVRQLQPQEPAVRDVDLDLVHHLTLRAHPRTGGR